MKITFVKKGKMLLTVQSIQKTLIRNTLRWVYLVNVSNLLFLFAVEKLRSEGLMRSISVKNWSCFMVSCLHFLQPYMNIWYIILYYIYIYIHIFIYIYKFIEGESTIKKLQMLLKMINSSSKAVIEKSVENNCFLHFW